MNHIGDEYRVHEDQKVKLSEWPTDSPPIYGSKKHYQELLAAHVEQLSALQQLLYASNEHSVLLIFQAMDAAGKDGAIKHVMSGVNPQGCQVFSFKHPSATELDHDFLWRTTQCLPERGRIGIFNRSYYEEVLIVRVHPQLLRSEHIPAGSHDENTIWKTRYRSIVQHEDHLTETEHASSSSSSTCRRKNSAYGSSIASTSPTRTGSSAWPTSPRDHSGRITCPRTRIA